MVLDDHIAIGEGTRAILQAELDCQAVVFTDPCIALQHLSESFYDIYLIDFNLAGMDGLQFIQKLLKIHPEAITIIYTGYNIEKYLPELLNKGISGFISKTESRKQLIDTIQYALEGKVIISLSLLKKLCVHNVGAKESINLTERERQILDFVRDGYTNKAIALEIYLSQRTIEKVLTTIFSKLGVESRAEAAVKWNELTTLETDKYHFN
ncbi:response regulator [Lysinibacillus sphaericus]|uniref:response regulator n=1 Tax=Lysinibacillus sphaericus TaxID=1421 RepID=UPI00382CAD57